jgi:hypothetical protein
MRSLLLASLVATSSIAAADPMSVGFRVGGYGFRRENSSSLGGENSAWDQCRMNGLGLFGTHTLTGPLFVEAALDTYFSTGQAQASDLPIDRQSALVSISGGVRTQVTSWLAGYAQLGIGMELTRVAVQYGDAGSIRDNKVLPDGFFGIGGDLRIARGTYVGANLRTLVMGNFDYDPARLQMQNPWVAAPRSSDVFSASPALAAQGQFFIRHDL